MALRLQPCQQLASTPDQLELNGDSDWWKMSVVAGLQYSVTLTANILTGTPLDNGLFRLLDQNGQQFDYAYKGSTLSFTASVTGTFFVAVEDWQTSDSAAEGDYAITVNKGDTIVNSAATTQTLTNGISAVQSLGQNGNSDWFKVSMIKGRAYSFSVDKQPDHLFCRRQELSRRSERGSACEAAGLHRFAAHWHRDHHLG